MSEFEITPESLPSSWVVTNLGSVVDYGKTAKAEPSEIPGDAWVLELEDIEKDSSRILGRFTQSQRQSRSTKNRFNAGDVLYGKLRPYLNKVVIADEPGFCTTEIVPLPANPALDNRYLFHWLKHPAFLKYVGAASHGMNMPRLGTEAGRSAPLVVAPRREQTRIADQLDTLLARIQACNDRLNAIPALLKRFRQAVLRAAVSGELTSDLRDTKKLQPWTRSTVGELTLSSYYGPRFGKEDYTQNTAGIPTVRTTDMDGVGGIQVTNETPRVLVPKEKLEQFLVKTGDLLITRTGSIGVMAVFEGSYKAIPSAYLIRFRFQPRVRAKYVYYRLASPNGQAELGLSATAVTQSNVNAEAIKRLSLELPGLQEQDEIIRRVESLYRVAERIEASLQRAWIAAQRLPLATLAKAFRGDLVQQDPKEEPASVLLQHIASTPATAAKARRGRSRSSQQLSTPKLSSMLPDWASLPAGAWAASGQPDEHATTAQLIAVLKAWGEPMPQDQARLAAVLCLQPRLFTAALPAQDAASWRHLVGDEAEPLPASVAALQPAVNTHWRRALAGLRTRGDLVVSGSGPQDTWALGPGANRVDTTGWPHGRAGWVAAYLRAHGVEALLPLLSPAAVDFVHARAA